MTNTLALPPGAEHKVVCKFTNILNFRRTIAELPLSQLQFSKSLNTPGPFSGLLATEDSAVQKASWRAATSVNRAALWIDIDGTLLYGGIVQGRQHDEATGIATVTGADFRVYFSQRLQAQDYENYMDPEGRKWAIDPGAPVARIAYYLLTQALEKAYSIPIKVATSGPTPAEAFWMTFSAPLTQHQALGSILSQMDSLGFMVGIDHAQDLSYDANGAPTVTVTLTYPRRGSGIPIVIETGSGVNLQYDEDGTQQADRVVEQAGATEARSSLGIWTPASAAGYPLLEITVSHSALAPTENQDHRVLEAYVGGDLVTHAFPYTAPVVTLPMFGTPSVFELDVGQDILLKVPKAAGAQPPPNTRFPNGLEALLRIVRIDCEIPDEGVPTMAITLNLRPSTAPVEPPETRLKGEGGGGPEGGGPGEEQSPAEAAAEKAAEAAATAEGLAALEVEVARLKAITEAKEKRIKVAKEKEEKREKTEKEAKEALEKAGFAVGTVGGLGAIVSGTNYLVSTTSASMVYLSILTSGGKGKTTINVSVGGEALFKLEWAEENFYETVVPFLVPANTNFKVSVGGTKETTMKANYQLV